MARLRAGVLGLGIGRLHALAYEDHPRVKLAAVCDQDPRKLSDFCVQHNLEAVQYSAYQDMLEQGHLDLVSVCTPDFMHADHALQALSAGSHVLIEKPLATTLNDALRIVEAVERSGQTAMVSHQLRWVPMFQEAKHRCAAGDLGTLFYLESDFLQNKVGQFERASWYKDPMRVRDPLLGTGCHNVDIMRWIAGEVVEVVAFANHLVFSEFPTDDLIVALFYFASGAVGKVTISYGCAVPRGYPAMSLRVFGSGGTIENEHLYTGADQEGEWEPLLTESAPWTPAAYHNAAIAHFVDCIVSGKQPLVDVNEGARTVAACLAGIEANCTGRPVRPVRI